MPLSVVSAPDSSISGDPQARFIRVRGVVQGVGFRPFVWHLAQALHLTGWVRNDGDGVAIQVAGADPVLDDFVQRLRAEAPPLARIDSILVELVSAEERNGFGAGFVIDDSRSSGAVRTAIGHDTAPCRDCLAELFDPKNRRWRHGFITCTHCGPRYTVTRRLPYDRPQTSLAPFPLCPRCAGEYTDPADRRFHAETTCCPDCGPRLALLDAAGVPLAGDPLAVTLTRLHAGDILAIKGLGGFHLVCDARNADAVARLRERKQREEKPFAVMVAAVSSAPTFCDCDDGSLRLLSRPERPIVLMPKRSDADRHLPGVAPGLAELGLMLPATPIQYLLFHEAAGRPAGLDWLSAPQSLALVMTSANPHGEPLVTCNDEALERLAGIADAFLIHDRDIVVRCDDSVLRWHGEAPTFVRRARGYVPGAIPLTRGGPPVIAFGGWFKNTVCVLRDDEAFVSQHIGDLDNAAACAFLDETVEHMLAMLDVTPSVVTGDLHPDFHSTRQAAAFAAAHGVPLLPVQHHHAHIAAVCAEQGIDRPVLGLALDGVGLGSDGNAWGGELLHVAGAACKRLGHLRPLALPGGDVAAREPWRMAASALHLLGRGDEIATRFADEAAAPIVARMLAGSINSPQTSSAGRWFDAAAGLLGVRRRSAFEGQAAMLLEGLAARHDVTNPLAAVLADGWQVNAEGQLDLAPLLDHLTTLPADALTFGAARFHATFAAALADWVGSAAAQTGLDCVVGAGGCFLNRRLVDALRVALVSRGLRFVTARALPPNDGGLSLGQAWVARQSMEN
jgi:hydrogenase maturation protein HypF